MLFSLTYLTIDSGIYCYLPSRFSSCSLFIPTVVTVIGISHPSSIAFRGKFSYSSILYYGHKQSAVAWMLHPALFLSSADCMHCGSLWVYIHYQNCISELFISSCLLYGLIFHLNSPHLWRDTAVWWCDVKMEIQKINWKKWSENCRLRWLLSNMNKSTWKCVNVSTVPVCLCIFTSVGCSWVIGFWLMTVHRCCRRIGKPWSAEWLWGLVYGVSQMFLHGSEALSICVAFLNEDYLS